MIHSSEISFLNK